MYVSPDSTPKEGLGEATRICRTDQPVSIAPNLSHETENLGDNVLAGLGKSADCDLTVVQPQNDTLLVLSLNSSCYFASLTQALEEPPAALDNITPNQTLSVSAFFGLSLDAAVEKEGPLIMRQVAMRLTAHALRTAAATLRSPLTDCRSADCHTMDPREQADEVLWQLKNAVPHHHWQGPTTLHGRVQYLMTLLKHVLERWPQSIESWLGLLTGDAEATEAMRCITQTSNALKQSPEDVCGAWAATNLLSAWQVPGISFTSTGPNDLLQGVDESDRFRAPDLERAASPAKAGVPTQSVGNNPPTSQIQGPLEGSDNEPAPFERLSLSIHGSPLGRASRMSSKRGILDIQKSSPVGSQDDPIIIPDADSDSDLNSNRDSHTDPHLSEVSKVLCARATPGESDSTDDESLSTEFFAHSDRNAHRERPIRAKTRKLVDYSTKRHPQDKYLPGKRRQPRNAGAKPSTNKRRRLDDKTDD
ncbi:hypothetical protein LTR50_007355 [Elasticomyces elasticus]|nr:hypothetical protein LTR50_007355 [Elasticomyces elasticus]